MESKQTRSIVEALLFSGGGPLRAATLVEVIGEGVTKSDVRDAIRSLNEAYEAAGMTFRIEDMGGGFQLLSDPDYDPWIRKLQKTRQRARLSRAALEALAIIAYRQPITRPDVEDIRGVDCGGVMTTLLERGLIKISGRSEAVGRPLLYATTPAFLDHFGLRSLAQLPKMDKIAESLDRKTLADSLAEEVGGEPLDFAETIERRLASIRVETPVPEPAVATDPDAEGEGEAAPTDAPRQAEDPSLQDRSRDEATGEAPDDGVLVSGDPDPTGG